MCKFIHSFRKHFEEILKFKPTECKHFSSSKRNILQVHKKKVHKGFIGAHIVDIFPCVQQYKIDWCRGVSGHQYRCI